MNFVKKFFPVVLSVFCSLIFLDSLRFKFTNHPNTQEIFGRLNEWASSFGAEGLFAQTGLFSQYTIGVAELFASALLILGLLPRFPRFQGLGALIGLGVMTGAISFHLFTPLGIDPNNDGGGLFIAACLVWTSCAVLVFLNRKKILATLRGIASTVLSKT